MVSADTVLLMSKRKRQREIAVLREEIRVLRRRLQQQPSRRPQPNPWERVAKAIEGVFARLGPQDLIYVALLFISKQVFVDTIPETVKPYLERSGDSLVVLFLPFVGWAAELIFALALLYAVGRRRH